MNNVDRELLLFVDTLANEAFQKVTGNLPADSEREKFYSQIYILPFDFAEAGSTMDEATDQLGAMKKSDLRLRSPNQAAEAWRLLLQKVRDFGPNRTGGDRAYFASLLAQKGYSLRPEQRFKAPIECLRTAARDFASCSPTMLPWAARSRSRLAWS